MGFRPSARRLDDLELACRWSTTLTGGNTCRPLCRRERKKISSSTTGAFLTVVGLSLSRRILCLWLGTLFPKRGCFRKLIPIPQNYCQPQSSCAGGLRPLMSSSFMFPWHDTSGYIYIYTLYIYIYNISSPSFCCWCSIFHSKRCSPHSLTQGKAGCMAIGCHRCCPWTVSGGCCVEVCWGLPLFWRFLTCVPAGMANPSHCCKKTATTSQAWMNFLWRSSAQFERALVWRMLRCHLLPCHPCREAGGVQKHISEVLLALYIYKFFHAAVGCQYSAVPFWTVIVTFLVQVRMSSEIEIWYQRLWPTSRTAISCRTSLVLCSENQEFILEERFLPASMKILN